MAALSVSTAPSGATSVGTCCSGLTARNWSRAESGSHVAASTMRCGSWPSTSAASTAADPDPVAP